jgi:hypothetical protein
MGQICRHRLARHVTKKASPSDCVLRDIPAQEGGERRCRPAARQETRRHRRQRQILAPIAADLAGLRDRALLLVGFASALRRSELAAILVEHLEPANAGLRVTLPHCKGERIGRGVTVALPYGTTELCPIRAVRSWQAAGIAAGALFRRIWTPPRERDGSNTPSPASAAWRSMPARRPDHPGPRALRGPGTSGVEDLLDNPARPGARQVGGRLHYHLRHSSTRVPKELGKVGLPRHLIVARVAGEDLLVLAFGHDRMVDEVAARIDEGEEG